jgi:hypothetical protein
LLGAGKSISQACKEAGITEVTYYRWRKEYNTVMSHSSLGYRPLALATIDPKTPALALEQAAGMQ